MKLSDNQIIKIKRHRRQPLYGRLLNTLNSSFNIMIFTQQIYEIGRGGFGRCYLGKLCSEHGKQLASDLNTSFKQLMEDKNTVVVKVIPKDKNKHNQDIYSRQINNLASVHQGNDRKECQNIVKVYPFKLESDQNYYIVMQYCYQSSLAQLIQTRKRAKRKFNLGQFLAIMKNILDGYQLLKAKSIIHNDIKPHNIFIKDKIFKIGDFGISDKLGPRQNISSTHCTLIYSPLQKIQGKPVNHKADIYSIGITLAQILFGKHPFFDQYTWQEYKKQQKLKEQEQQIMMEIQDIHNPYEKVELLNKQKIKQKNYFCNYIRLRNKNQIYHNIEIRYNQQDQQLVQKIKQLVWDMCKEVENRPTLEQINFRLDNLPKSISNTMSWYSKFDDLHIMSDSQLNFQLQNIPMEKYSKIIRKDIKNSFHNKNYSLNSFDKAQQIKNIVNQTSNYVKNVYLATTKLEATEKKEQQDILHLKLDLFTYIYWVNRTTLMDINNKLVYLNHEDLNEVYRQCIEKGIRNMRLDDQFLGQLVLIEDKQINRLKFYRQIVLNTLNKILKINQKDYIILINEERYQKYFWLFVIFSFLKNEQKYSNIHTRQFGDIITNLSDKMKKIQYIQNGQINYQQIFKQWQNYFHLIYQIPT